jgi:hypothetical protein
MHERPSWSPGAPAMLSDCQSRQQRCETGRFGSDGLRFIGRALFLRCVRSVVPPALIAGAMAQRYLAVHAVSHRPPRP